MLLIVYEAPSLLLCHTVGPYVNYVIASPFFLFPCPFYSIMWKHLLWKYMRKNRLPIIIRINGKNCIPIIQELEEPVIASNYLYAWTYFGNFYCNVFLSIPYAAIKSSHKKVPICYPSSVLGSVWINGPKIIFQPIMIPPCVK